MSNNKPTPIAWAFESHRSKGQHRPFPNLSLSHIPNQVPQSEQAALLRQEDEKIIAQALKLGVESDNALFQKAEAVFLEVRNYGQTLSQKGRNQKPS